MSPDARRRSVVPALASLGLAALQAGCSEPASDPFGAPDSGELGPARLVAEAPRHDFGLLWEGVQVAHTFRLGVAGEGTISIAGVKPGCGCTLVELAVCAAGGRRPLDFGEPLASGTELELSARLDTRGRAGSVPREITLYDSSPEGRTLLELAAEVRSLLVVEPPRVELGRFRAELGARGTATLVAPGGERFLLRADPAASGLLFAQLAPLEADAQGRAHTWRVEVGFAPGGAPGPRSAGIELVTDLALEGAPSGCHARTLYVWGEALGALDVQPGMLAFGLLRPGDVAARGALVRSTEPADERAALPGLGEPRARVLAESESEDVRAAQGEGTPFPWPGATVNLRAAAGGAWQVELLLVVPADAPPGSFAGSVRLELDAAAGFPLEIPFSGAVTVPARR